MTNITKIREETSRARVKTAVTDTTGHGSAGQECYLQGVNNRALGSWATDPVYCELAQQVTRKHLSGNTENNEFEE